MANTNGMRQRDVEEIGVLRPPGAPRPRIALVYPNTYAVGMSNLGFQTLYRLFNLHGATCERVFLPDEGEGAGPLRTLESGTPLAEMDVVAFSVSFELDYPHLPRILRLGGIEPFAEARYGPLVIAGGATVSYNPEPIAPFCDAMVIGEAEGSVPALVAALREDRAAALDAMARLPGVYLPARAITPVGRLIVRDLDVIPVNTQVYTPHTEFGEMALIEVGRGCPYGCRFCIASHVYRPARWRSLAGLLPQIERGLTHRRRIGLVGASVTDHPAIIPLCEEILARGGEPAPASMRADALTAPLLALLTRGGVRTVTLAPEAGREALRAAIGKRLSDEAIIAAAIRAREAGIAQLKLYFIIGLPGETPDDVEAIPTLALRIAREAGVRVTLGCSVFVPKPGTPFAREAMIPEGDARRRLAVIRQRLRGRLPFTHESARWAYWQGVLARGGREQAHALARIAQSAQRGADWVQAFRAVGLDADAAILRPIPPEVTVPWANIGGSRCVAGDDETGEKAYNEIPPAWE